MNSGLNFKTLQSFNFNKKVSKILFNLSNQLQVNLLCKEITTEPSKTEYGTFPDSHVGTRWCNGISKKTYTRD